MNQQILTTASAAFVVSAPRQEIRVLPVDGNAERFGWCAELYIDGRFSAVLSSFALTPDQAQAEAEAAL